MMTASIPADVLQQLPVFAGMSVEERQRLVDISKVMYFKAGDELLRQGKNGQNFLVLLEGKCQVSRQVRDSGGSAIVLADLEPPAHFGEMSFFHKAPHSANVRATTNVILLRFVRADYNRLIDNGDIAAYKLALNAVDLMADRLRRMDQWVTELVCREKNEQQVSEWTRFRQKLFASS